MLICLDMGILSYCSMEKILDVVITLPTEKLKTWQLMNEQILGYERFLNKTFI